MGMIQLSQETQALAERIAAAQRLPVEVAIRQALETHARVVGIAAQETRRRRDLTPEAVAARVARFEAFAQRIEAAPINDPRPIREIVDELNAL
jgi:hypothetical protein